MRDDEVTDAEFRDLLVRGVTALETLANYLCGTPEDRQVAEYSTVIIGPEDEAPAEGPEEGIAHGHPIDEEVAHAAMDPLCNPEAPRFDEFCSECGEALTSWGECVNGECPSCGASMTTSESSASSNSEELRDMEGGE